MEKKQLYEQAHQEWGLFFQTLMVLEESAELSMELTKLCKMPLMNKVAEQQFEQCKAIRNGYVSDELKRMTYDVSDNLVEEIADVEIMLEQLKQMHNIGPHVALRKNVKLDRLKRMLKSTRV